MGFQKKTNSTFKSGCNHSSGTKGTPLYLVPEIWQNEDDTIYSSSSIIYAFGLIIYEQITDKKPFSKCGMQELMVKIVNGIRLKFNSSIPESYQNLIEKSWSQNPADRPTADEILSELETDPGFITDLIDRLKIKSTVKMSFHLFRLE